MKKILNLIAFLVAMTNTTTAQNTAQPANLTIYDSEGNLTDSYEFKYDANGNQIEETDFSSDELVGNMIFLKQNLNTPSWVTPNTVMSGLMPGGKLSLRMCIVSLLMAISLPTTRIKAVTLC